MVNEAYLNRLNAWLIQKISAKREVREVDRLHPFRLRIVHQGTDRERDAVGDAALLGMQPAEPGLAGERIGQWPLPELDEQQRERSAEQRGVEQVVHQVRKAEPEPRGGGDLGVPAADPAHGEAQ